MTHEFWNVWLVSALVLLCIGICIWIYVPIFWNEWNERQRRKRLLALRDRLYLIPIGLPCIEIPDENDADAWYFYASFKEHLVQRFGFGAVPEDAIIRTGFDNLRWTREFATCADSDLVLIDFTKSQGTERAVAFIHFRRRFRAALERIQTFDGKQLVLTIFRGDGDPDKRVYQWEIGDRE
jgi:hypothetical protein